MYISSFVNIFNTIIATTYIKVANAIAKSVAIFSEIILLKIINTAYEHIAIINVANTGLITNFEKFKSNLIFFLSTFIAIVNATM